MSFQGKFVVSVSLISLFVSSAFAEPKSRGRLPDGRAYRVDDNGYQLVDRIAELEVSSAELEQQVANLEQELEQKEQSCGASAKGSSEIPNCSELVSELHLKVARLQSQAGQNHTLPAAAQACNFNSPENPYLGRVSQLEQQVQAMGMQAKQYEAQSKAVNDCDYQSQQNPLWEQVKALQQQLKGKESEVDTLAAQLQSKDTELTKLAEKFRDSESATPGQTVKAASSRARMESPVSKIELTRTDKELPSVDVKGVQREIQAKLRNIEQLILARKSSYDRLKQENPSITIKISPLRTASGVSLDALRSQIGKISSSSNASEIQAGLTEIQKTLEDDTKVIKRLLKL